MKNASVISCLLLCSLFSLIACTKNNDTVSTTPPQNGGDTTSTTTPDSTSSSVPKYQPGDTLIVRGDTSNNDETALLHSIDATVGTPGFPAFTAVGNDFGGMNGKDRSVMKFILRHIADSSRDNPPQIQKAVLYLYQYSDAGSQDPYSFQQNADNAAELHRIVGDWNDSTVTWNTQPALASGSANPLEDVVTIPAITTPLATGTRDDQEIDVTDMMRKIFETHSNKGFLIKLANEDAKCMRSFGSFACPNTSKRPKLIIYF